jgi:hypothetical protein
MRVRVFLACVCAVVAGLASACSSTPPATPDDEATDPTATEASADPTGNPRELSCALAPAAVVKSTLSIDVSPPAQVANGAATECTYLSGVGGSTVTVRMQTGDGAEAFAIGRRGFDEGGQPTSDVSGLGDEAYMSSTEFGDVVTNTLVARKGAVEVLVAAAAPVAAEKALIQKVFEAAAA